MNKFTKEDKLIISRQNADMGPENLVVTGEDVNDFIVEIQERFTKEIADKVDVVVDDSQKNNDKIIENENENNKVHDELRAEIDENAVEIQETSDKNDEQDQRLFELERNERVFGFYGYAFSNNVSVVSNKVSVPEGFFVGTKADGKTAVYDNFRNIKKLTFNKTDTQGNKRLFKYLLRGDVVELIFMNSGFDTLIAESRASFRITQEQTQTASEQVGSDLFTVDVELVNGRGDNQPTYDPDNPDATINLGIPVHVEKPEGFDRVVKTAAWPSQSIDEISPIDVIERSMVQIGSIIMWPTQRNIPEGWLICDGTSYSSLRSNAKYNRNDIDKLAAVTGGSYIPDMRGRMPISTLHNNNGSRVSSSQSRYSINSIGPTDQSIRLEKSWFIMGTESNHTHNLTVDELVARHRNHQHRFGDLDNGSQGKSIKAHAMRLNNKNSARTSEAGAHTHNITIESAGSHSHGIKMNSVSILGNETRFCSFGTTFIIKYKQLI